MNETRPWVNLVSFDGLRVLHEGKRVWFERYVRDTVFLMELRKIQRPRNLIETLI